jgi:hypothetical protein
MLSYQRVRSARAQLSCHTAVNTASVTAATVTIAGAATAGVSTAGVSTAAGRPLPLPWGALHLSKGAPVVQHWLYMQHKVQSIECMVSTTATRSASLCLWAVRACKRCDEFQH